jgi:uncharacterized protein
MNALDSLIVKVAAPCNLACTYCYEYNAGDFSWQKKPKSMAMETIERLGFRIREYASQTDCGRLRVVAHGGEPLLLGAKGLNSFFACLSAAASPVQLQFSLQTNATLITPDICAVLRRHGVLVGVSLDGGEAHNARRIDHQGRPSWDRVVSGISHLKEYAPECFGGLLCVIELAHAPEDVIDALCAFKPPQIDLLQPFTTHDALGARRADAAKAFGEWMTRALRHWLRSPQLSSTKIRVFEDALAAVITGKAATDWFGPRRSGYLIVETDGAFDLLDSLKVIGSASSSFRQTGRSVENCSLTEAALAAQAVLRQGGGDRLPAGCADCRWATVCAGGYLPGRYSAASGFDNPSVYCEGIQALLDESLSIMSDHVARRNHAVGSTAGAAHL